MPDPSSKQAFILPLASAEKTFKTAKGNKNITTSVSIAGAVWNKQLPVGSH
jgi:hypothetical protein